MTQLEKFCSTIQDGTIYTCGDLDHFQQLSEIDKLRSYSGVVKVVYPVKHFSDSVVFSKILVKYKRVGRTIFPTITKNIIIRITKNKVVVNASNPAMIDYLEKLFKYLDIKWIQQDIISEYYDFLCKPAILKAIFVNKIYSEETLVKSIAATCFKVKDCNWRLLRAYFQLSNPTSLIDIKLFTKNLESSLQAFINAKYKPVASLYRDLIYNAMLLGEVVDLTWSEKRMNQEHLRQNNILNRMQIEKMSKDTFCDYDLTQNKFRMLNTEIDVWNESQIMHNCIYNCYLQRIKNVKYIAFHYSGEEECVFGVHLINDTVEIEQIKGRYNTIPTTKSCDIIRQFVDNHKTKLKQILLSKPKEFIQNTTGNIIFTPDQDLPW